MATAIGIRDKPTLRMNPGCRVSTSTCTNSSNRPRRSPSSLSGPVTTFFWEKVGDATSDVHGEFWFTQLYAGTYEVRERAGQAFMQTTKQPQRHRTSSSTRPPPPASLSSKAGANSSGNWIRPLC